MDCIVYNDSMFKLKKGYPLFKEVEEVSDN